MGGILARFVAFCRWLALLGIVWSLFSPLAAVRTAGEEAPQVAAASARFFPQTGFAVRDDAFWDYFQHRGGVRTFGYPVSRQLRARRLRGTGLPTSRAAEAVRRPRGQLNLADPGLLPYSSFNYAQLPAVDPALTATAPAPGSPGYAAAVLAWVEAHAPESFAGLPVRFYSTFLESVGREEALPAGGDDNLLAGFALEIWGLPTSAPAFDPNNHESSTCAFSVG